MRLKPTRWFAAGLMAMATINGTAIAGTRADDIGQGLTALVVLPAFDLNAPVCAAPAGLSPVLAFARDNAGTSWLGRSQPCATRVGCGLTSSSVA